jgi:hypothetical protein
VASAWAVEIRMNWSASAAIRAQTDDRPTWTTLQRSHNILARAEFQGAGKYFRGFLSKPHDFVPKKTPRDTVARIHAELVKAIESSSVKDKLVKLGVEPMIMQPEDFDARIAEEAGMAVMLAKAANIRLQ